MRGGPLFEVRLESSLKTFVPLTRIQKLIGKRMLTSKRTKPCFYLERKADVTDLLAARHALSKLHGVKITSNSFLIHALALAARQYPLVLGRLRNDGADASLDSAVIDIPDEINVGFAVNSPQGLVVPVVKNADRKTLAQIADAVATILTTQADKYFSQLSTESAVIALIDAPAISPVGRSLRDRIDLPLRLLLALAAGIALTFLLDYIDASIRNRDDLATLGLPILGEIPPRQRWRTYLPLKRSLP